ncbi:SapC family protein [Kordiimonas sp.]|uniref:SapC family protein n=1 Tax=Kordiimonas sp. TaxID=1970157 RepID=UPI003A8ED0AD
MPNIKMLDNVEHHNLKVKPERGAVFGDNVNQALVFPNEFRDLQREYPILFRKNAEGAFQAVALLGLDRDENLYLGGDGWDANYIPAVLARGPFSIGLQRGDGASATEADAKIQIDLDNAAVNTQEGHPLFLPQGGNAPYLEYIIAVLRTLHDGIGVAKMFFDALDSLKLIEPVTLEVKISETRQYTVPDVYSISEEKFQNLPADELNKLHKSGLLAPCYWVQSSLDNIRQLVARKNKV